MHTDAQSLLRASASPKVADFFLTIVLKEKENVEQALNNLSHHTAPSVAMLHNTALPSPSPVL